MKSNQTSETAAFSQSGEDQIRSQTPSTAAPLSADETERLMHEMQVYQIELEMQEARVQMKLAAPRSAGE